MEWSKLMGRIIICDGELRKNQKRKYKFIIDRPELEKNQRTQAQKTRINGMRWTAFSENLARLFSFFNVTSELIPCSYTGSPSLPSNLLVLTVLYMILLFFFFFFFFSWENWWKKMGNEEEEEDNWRIVLSIEFSCGDWGVKFGKTICMHLYLLVIVSNVCSCFWH